MQKRTIEIIRTLLQNKGASNTIGSLAVQQGVSERTIRNDLAVINDTLSQNGLTKLEFSKNGKILCQEDFQEILQYLPENDFYTYKLSKEERKIIASTLLVQAPTYITLSTIAEQLAVSRATIISDLESIKRFLQENQLTVHSHSNKGLRVEGLESDKRKLLLKIATAETSFAHMDINKVIGLQAGDIVTIRKIVNEQEHCNNFFLTDESFQLVLIYLRIMLQRNQQGAYVEQCTEDGNDKYRMAQDILKYVTQYCETISTESEIVFLSKFLDRCQYIKRQVNESGMVKIQLLTRRFIEAVSEELGIPLQNDYDFYENLSNHLESIFRNQNFNLSMQPIHEEVAAKNREVLDIVTRHSELLEQHVERELTEVEKIYIVLHVCAAIERQKNKNIAFHVILVCHGGIGTSQLLLARLRNHFRFQIVDIISAHEVENITPDQADLLITTVEVKHSAIDSVKVSPLLSDEDYIRVGAKIDALRNTLHLPVREEKKELTTKAVLARIKPVLYREVPEKAGKLMTLLKKELYEYFRIVNSEEESQVFSPSLHHLLSEQYITLDVVADTWQEAVAQSAAVLLQKQYIEEKYIQAMIENIEENGPYIIISEGFALPHEGIDKGTMKTGMSLIRLKEPVVFEETYAPVKFVCCLSAVDHKTHLKALFHLVNLLQQPAFKRDMEDAKTPKELANCIEGYEYMLQA